MLSSELNVDQSRQVVSGNGRLTVRIIASQLDMKKYRV